MLMSQEARSSGEIGFPRFGDCAKAAEPSATSTPAAMSLRIDMLDLALVGDAPGGDHVVVEVAAVATRRDELRAVRLHVAGFVGGAALQRDGRAVPPPR